MKIDKIEKLKDNKYKITIDGEVITTFDDVILDNNLLFKKEIDIELYNIIIKDTEYYTGYNKVVKYILKRRRSEKEIKEYLIKLQLKENDIAKIINKLKSINLINDREYCKAFINDKVNLSKQGINKIRLNLLQQDIPIEIIEEELKKIDSDILNNRLEKLIIKKIDSNRKYSKNILKQRILNEMINLGYNKETILDILDENIRDDQNIIEKEFEKIYNKFSKKYTGNELNIKIKQKLLSKSFNSEDIDSLIQKKTEE